MIEQLLVLPSQTPDV